MDILDIIKRRASVRKYKDKSIPKEVLDKIIEAGIWGPAVPSFLAMQPWKFIVVVNSEKINNLSRILSEKAMESSIGVRVLLNPASKIVSSAKVVIAVYNSNDLRDIEKKCKTVYEEYKTIIKTAQISAISAAIQNMTLVAEHFEIGTCWLDTPLFCKDEISKFLSVDSDSDLIAFLTLGYPSQVGKRSKRKSLTESVEILN